MSYRDTPNSHIHSIYRYYCSLVGNTKSSSTVCVFRQAPEFIGYHVVLREVVVCMGWSELCHNFSTLGQ